jgi:formamidopyrimidine-DNA glycosylase
MPEGPEVRRYATQLAGALENQPVLQLSARTREARAWLESHPDALQNCCVEQIRSHGKHLYGTLESGVGFHSHLMMWGRWFIHPGDALVERDRRERARIVTPNAIAILFSAPVFDIFEGDPYEQIENLATLGPDILPYSGTFDRAEWERRLKQTENLEREIGAVLLDQRVCAGVGNYLRADMLFFCRIDPWKRVSDLSPAEIDCLAAEMPRVARRAFEGEGTSVPPEMRQRMLTDPSLSYGEEIREYGARHAVFRRTNLPCLVCGTPIKQKQQVVYRTPDGDDVNEPVDEKARIIYFCPQCQGVDPERFAPKKTTRKTKSAANLSGP